MPHTTLHCLLAVTSPTGNQRGVGVGCVQRAAQATRRGALQLQGGRRSLWLTPAYMMLACHGPFDLCAFMLCAEAQHSWTCISEVSEAAPQYMPAAHQQQRSRMRSKAGGPFRRSSAASIPPSRAPGRSIPRWAGQTGQNKNRSFACARCSSEQGPLLRLFVFVITPPVHGKVHFRCMSTSQVVTPDLSLPPSKS